MNASAVKKGHVNFGSEDSGLKTDKDNTVTITQCHPGRIEVNLGFLKYEHIYSISIEMPQSYFLGYDLKSILEAVKKSVPNDVWKIVSIEERGDSYVLGVEFHAIKEWLLTQDLKLSLEDNFEIVIVLFARVLGPGRGNPLLKNEIKCIGVDTDKLSEV